MLFKICLILCLDASQGSETETATTNTSWRSLNILRKQLGSKCPINTFGIQGSSGMTLEKVLIYYRRDQSVFK